MKHLNFVNIFLLIFLGFSSISKASELMLLCEGKSQDIFGDWKIISSLITIKDDNYSCKDTKKREFGCILVEGPVRMSDEYVFLYDGGTLSDDSASSIDRTTGQFVYSNDIRGLVGSYDIKCTPKKAKLF